MSFSDMKAKSLKIKELNGGINRRDAVNMIKDNQLTDCLNMWWYEGALRTRPSAEETFVSSNNGITPKLCRHNCYKLQNDRKYQLFSAKSVEKTGDIYKTVIQFFWCSGKNAVALAPLEISLKYELESYFVFYHNDTVYCFSSDKKIRKYMEQLSRWTLVTEDGEDKNERIYIPLIATHCKTDGSISMTREDILKTADLCEAYNILSCYYRIQYDAFNIKACSGEEEIKRHTMMYFLPERIDDDRYKGKSLTVKLRRNGQLFTHTVTLVGAENGGVTEEATLKADGYKIRVNTNRVTFVDSTGSTVWITESDAESFIEICAPYIPLDRNEAVESIYSMSIACPYGGSADTLYGGTRLFVSGSKREKALVMWSGRNNPLYFPENSYFYVGNKADSVTGFGNQGDSLIIFKSDEIWCAEHSSTKREEQTDILSGIAVDKATSSAYFPLTLISTEAGCTFTDTVSLCRNRLVWYTTGGVYTLVTENPNSRSRVFCVSEAINPSLRRESGSATATNWQGHYLLCFNNRIYLMDYNSYGFQYSSSFTKTEDSNIRIPWYYWQLPTKADKSALSSVYGDFTLLCADEEKTFCVSLVENNGRDILLSGEGETECYFATKLFDFSEFSNLKNIDKVDILLCGNAERVEFITDKGTVSEELEPDFNGFSYQGKAVAFSKTIYPTIKAVRLFAVRVSGKGNVEALSLKFNYSILK